MNTTTKDESEKAVAVITNTCLGFVAMISYFNTRAHKFWIKLRGRRERQWGKCTIMDSSTKTHLGHSTDNPEVFDASASSKQLVLNLLSEDRASPIYHNFPFFSRSEG